MLKSIIKTALRVVSIPGRLLARLWARPGYFHERDLQRLEAVRIALIACHWLGDTFWASQVVPTLARLLGDVAAPNTGMCLDTGHAHMVGDAAQAVRDGDGQILYVHFSDNSGLEDDHEMPTYGTLPAEAVGRALGEIGYDGVMMLEVFHQPAVLRRLIEDRCAERLAKILDIANARSPDIA